MTEDCTAMKQNILRTTWAPSQLQMPQMRPDTELRGRVASRCQREGPCEEQWEMTEGGPVGSRANRSVLHFDLEDGFYKNSPSYKQDLS